MKKRWDDEDRVIGSFNAQGYVPIKEFAEVCRYMKETGLLESGRVSISFVVKMCLLKVHFELVREEQRFESIEEARRYLGDIGISMRQYEGMERTRRALTRDLEREDRRFERGHLFPNTVPAPNRYSMSPTLGTFDPDTITQEEVEEIAERVRRRQKEDTDMKEEIRRLASMPRKEQAGEAS